MKYILYSICLLSISLAPLAILSLVTISMGLTHPGGILDVFINVALVLKLIHFLIAITFDMMQIYKNPFDFNNRKNAILWPIFSLITRFFKNLKEYEL